MRLLILFIAIFSSLISYGQTRTITGTGDWDAANRWDGNLIANSINHNVVFDNGGGKTITIRNGFSYTIGTFDIDNDALVVQTGGSLTLGANGTPKNFTGDNGATMTVAGNLVIWGDLIVNNNLTWNVSGTVTINGNITVNNGAEFNVQNTGSMNVTGNLTGGNNTDLAINGTVNVGGSINVGNGSTLTGTGTLTGGSCTGPAAVCSDPQFLPIELLFFKSNITNNGVQLNWATAKEDNFDYFSVERSRNGHDFEEIAQVKGAGFSRSILNYSTLDAKPLNGRSYYRLKAIDLDETFEYSSIIAVNTQGGVAQAVQVSPNPLEGDRLNIIAANLNEEARVFIYDLAGTMVRDLIYTPGTELELNGTLNKGVYIVTVSNATYQGKTKLIVK